MFRVNLLIVSTCSLPLLCALVAKFTSTGLEAHLDQNSLYCFKQSDCSAAWIMLTSPEHVCCLQGHFQIVLNNDHCPLFQKDLSWFQRLMYCSGVWAYIVGAITTPMFIIIPLVSFIARTDPNMT